MVQKAQSTGKHQLIFTTSPLMNLCRRLFDNRNRDFAHQGADVLSRLNLILLLTSVLRAVGLFQQTFDSSFG